MPTCVNRPCDRPAAMKVAIRHADRRGAVLFEMCLPCSQFVSTLLDPGAQGTIESTPLLGVPASVQEIVERVGVIHEKQREHAEIQCIHEMTVATCPICLNGGRLGPLSNCLGCGESIVWVMTVNRKPMPLDADPVATGNVVYGDTLEGKVMIRVLKKDDLYSGLRYLPHQATCRHPPRRARG